MISIERDTTLLDSADYLKNAEDEAAYLAAALEDDDPILLAHALTAIVRVRARRSALTAGTAKYALPP